jgi:hypothetical protein
MKRILLTGMILTLLLSGCAGTHSRPDLDPPHLGEPCPQCAQAEIGDECSYMYRA